MRRHLDIEALRALDAVVREGNFARAAAYMCVTAPAISLQMKRLEEALGGQIFYKNGRAKQLTQKGLRLLEYARKMLQLNDSAVGEFTERPFHGRIRLGTSQDFAGESLIALLQDIQATHPGLQIDLVVDVNRRIHAAFEREELDLAIACADPQLPLVGEPILSSRLIWIGSPDFTVRPETALPLVLFPEPCIVRETMLRALDETGIEWRSACTTGSLEGLLTATQAGLGITARSRRQIGRGLSELTGIPGLPPLPSLDVVLRINENGPAPAELTRHVAERVRRHGERLDSSQRALR